MGLGVGSGVGSGVGVGATVGRGVGRGVRVGTGVGPAVSAGVGSGVGSGVRPGVGSTVGAGVGWAGVAAGAAEDATVGSGSEGPQAEMTNTLVSTNADSDGTAGRRRVRRGEWLIIGLTTPGWLGGASGWALEVAEELGSGLVTGAEQPEDR